MTYFNFSFKILFLKSKGYGSFENPRCGWKDNIRMHLSKIGWKVVDSTRLAQDKDQWLVLVNTVMNLQVP
jgi:hypothetical protein